MTMRTDILRSSPCRPLVAGLLALAACLPALDAPLAVPMGSTETTVIGDLLDGMAGSCFLDRWSFDTVNMCTHTWHIGPITIVLPTPCFQVSHPKIQALLHAAFMKLHWGVLAPAEGQGEYRSWVRSYNPEADQPLVREHGFRIGDMGFSGAISAQAYVASPPIVVAEVNAALNAFAATGLICNPLHDYTNAIAFGQVVWGSELDDRNGLSNWAAYTSWYFSTFTTSMLSVASSLFERTGLCPLQDFYPFLCHGSFGTVYPASGINNASSGLLGLFSTAQKAKAVTMAPFSFYGPRQMHIGGLLVYPAHNSLASGPIFLAPIMFYARALRGKFVQNLYKTMPPGAPTVATAESSCTADRGIDGLADGEAATFGSMYIGEMTHFINQHDPVIDYAEWPHYTCCQWCSGIEVGAPMGADIFTSAGGEVDDYPYVHFMIEGEGAITQNVMTFFE